MPENVRTWAAHALAGILGMPPDECGDIVDNILGYDDARELQDFLGAFADLSSQSKVAGFVDELFERRDGKRPSAAPAAPAKPAKPAPAAAAPAPAAAQAGRHADDAGDQRQAKGGGRGRGGKGGRGSYDDRQSGKGRGRGKGDGGGGAYPGGGSGGQGAATAEDHFPKLNMPTYQRDKADKRLMVIDASSGRHKVLTNCLNCGKVITEEEGWGPCLFCGNPLEVGDQYGVRHGDDRGITDSGLGAGITADEERFNAGFERAKATKDRLLSYDRDAKKRTKVFDDATDWYSESINPWLSEKQREEATRKQSEEERRKREEKRKIHAKIDIFGRTVISADAEIEEERLKTDKENFNKWNDKVVDENRLKAMYVENTRGMQAGTSQLSGDSKQLYDKLRASLHGSARKFDDSAWNPGAAEAADDGNGPPGEKKKRFYSTTDGSRMENEFTVFSADDFKGTSGKLLPVEESPYGDEDDAGQSLTMYQPWASLLVHGFKRAEGRSWTHPHRGRLWIHAAGKPPEQMEIDMLEAQYRSIYAQQGVPTPPLPSEVGGYPTSALLGCVDVEECWTSAEYTEVLRSTPSMPQEENTANYIFWCLRPRKLIVPVKMGGEHKIWKLPAASLRQAQRGLQPVRWPAPAEGEHALASPDLPKRATPSSATPAPDEKAAAPAAKAAPAPGQPTAAASSAPERKAKAAASTGFDLWPSAAPDEVLEMLERDRDSTDREVVVLQNGFVHLVGFIPPDMQQRIIDELRGPGLSEQGFFAERFDGTKVAASVVRMYLGKHWNSVAQRWEASRGNMDGQPPVGLPGLFQAMYTEAVKKANRELVRPQNKKRKMVPLPEGKVPDVGVVNFFQPSGTMQMHQDKQESVEAMNAGFPVMGICLGDSCDFSYGADAPSSNKKPKALRLESGDVYLFGGESRLLWHGVQKVHARTGPPSLKLVPGRLSVTLRVS